MLQENLKKVEQFWKKEGLILAKPLSENDVIKYFADLTILLSKEVIHVYSNVGGMDDDDMDSICFSFWTVK